MTDLDGVKLLSQKVRDEILRSAAILRPEELALSVEAIFDRALSTTPEAPGTGVAWDVEEFKVWKGIDPDKPRWHGRGYCCPSWGEAAELMEFLAHNDQTLLLRVSPFPATPAETQADEVGK